MRRHAIHTHAQQPSVHNPPHGLRCPLLLAATSEIFNFADARRRRTHLNVVAFVVVHNELILVGFFLGKGVCANTYLGALDFQFHVILARGFAVLTFFPAIAVTSIAHLFARVQQH